MRIRAERCNREAEAGGAYLVQAIISLRSALNVVLRWSGPPFLPLSLDAGTKISSLDANPNTRTTENFPLDCSSWLICTATCSFCKDI